MNKPQTDNIEDDEKKYFRTLITFSEIGLSINPQIIQSIEKSFRIKESVHNYETTPEPEYGILINYGIESSANNPKKSAELWYKDESYRDRRYRRIIATLDEIGIKVISV